MDAPMKALVEVDRKLVESRATFEGLKTDLEADFNRMLTDLEIDKIDAKTQVLSSTSAFQELLVGLGSDKTLVNGVEMSIATSKTSGSWVPPTNQWYKMIGVFPASQASMILKDVFVRVYNPMGGGGAGYVPDDYDAFYYFQDNIYDPGSIYTGPTQGMFGQKIHRSLWDTGFMPTATPPGFAMRCQGLAIPQSFEQNMQSNGQYAHLSSPSCFIFKNTCDSFLIGNNGFSIWVWNSNPGCLIDVLLSFAGDSQ